MRHRLLTLAVLAGTVWTAGVSSVAGAQRLAPKRALVATAPTGCAAFPAPVLPTAPSPLGEDPEARRLIDAGLEAALQGEHAEARNAFTEASRKSPNNARLAYYLGREHEELRDATAAVREYCRYLLLAPNAPDRDEVLGRVVRLVPASELARVDEARANFRSGVALLERRQFTAADSVFGTIAQQLPTAPEVFFNRGLARAARGERRAALTEFEKYLELAPSAADRSDVRSAMSQLQDRVYGGGQALLSGLVVPGMGQMSTGRPVFGVLVLGAVAGAAIFGLMQEETIEVATFTDPFGNPYIDSLPKTVRPNLVPAAIGAGVVWLGAAWEASRYANRTRARAEAIIALGESGRGILVGPGRNGATRLGMTLALGRPRPRN
jgi:tetratricopeptide (TPR) repeat protein